MSDPKKLIYGFFAMVQYVAFFKSRAFKSSSLVVFFWSSLFAIATRVVPNNDIPTAKREGVSCNINQCNQRVLSRILIK